MHTDTTHHGDLIASPGMIYQFEAITGSLYASGADTDSCLFCDNPRQLKHGCQKQRWLVCEKHITCKCPECGGLAHWMEGMKKGNYYLCFDSLACWWRAANPPNSDHPHQVST